MHYQLPNGKVVYLTIEQYLELTDLDIQYLMSIDFGEYVQDPFKGSAVEQNKSEKYYDFDYLNTDDENPNEKISDDEPFDDIIDLSDSLNN